MPNQVPTVVNTKIDDNSFDLTRNPKPFTYSYPYYNGTYIASTQYTGAVDTHFIELEDILTLTATGLILTRNDSGNFGTVNVTGDRIDVVLPLPKEFYNNVFISAKQEGAYPNRVRQEVLAQVQSHRTPLTLDTDDTIYYMQAPFRYRVNYAPEADNDYNTNAVHPIKEDYIIYAIDLDNFRIETFTVNDDSVDITSELPLEFYPTIQYEYLTNFTNGELYDGLNRVPPLITSISEGKLKETQGVITRNISSLSMGADNQNLLTLYGKDIDIYLAPKGSDIRDTSVLEHISTSRIDSLSQTDNMSSIEMSLNETRLDRPIEFDFPNFTITAILQQLLPGITADNVSTRTTIRASEDLSDVLGRLLATTSGTIVRDGANLIFKSYRPTESPPVAYISENAIVEIGDITIEAVPNAWTFEDSEPVAIVGKGDIMQEIKGVPLSNNDAIRFLGHYQDSYSDTTCSLTTHYPLVSNVQIQDIILVDFNVFGLEVFGGETKMCRVTGKTDNFTDFTSELELTIVDANQQAKNDRMRAIDRAGGITLDQATALINSTVNDAYIASQNYENYLGSLKARQSDVTYSSDDLPILVTFAPENTGDASITLTITYNANNEPIQTVLSEAPDGVPTTKTITYDANGLPTNTVYS